jgi:antitoxin component YwqK of YwqJK toxin-antitoxin module
MNSSDVQLKDGIIIRKDDNIPFTGIIVDYHTNNSKKYVAICEQGVVRLRTGYFESGKMMYQYSYYKNNMAGTITTH